MSFSCLKDTLAYSSKDSPDVLNAVAYKLVVPK